MAMSIWHAFAVPLHASSFVRQQIEFLRSFELPTLTDCEPHTNMGTLLQTTWTPNAKTWTDKRNFKYTSLFIADGRKCILDNYTVFVYVFVCCTQDAAVCSHHDSQESCLVVHHSICTVRSLLRTFHHRQTTLLSRRRMYLLTAVKDNSTETYSPFFCQSFQTVCRCRKTASALRLANITRTLFTSL